MTRECYICGQPIVKSNRALEHVIPNFLGGKISTRSFLCKQHNSDLSKVDDTLLELTVFANQLNVDRDRGDNPEIEYFLRDENGTSVSLLRSPDGNFFSESIKVTEGDSQFAYEIRLLTSDPKKKEATLKKIKDRFFADTAKLGWKAEKQNVEWKIFREKIQSVTRHIQPELEKRIEFSDDMFWGMLKIAVGYYLHNKLDKKYIFDKIQLLKDIAFGKELHEIDCVGWFYPKSFYNDKTIHHTLSIFGSRDSKLLYVLVSIFGVANVLVLLSNNYTGEDIRISYSFDFRRESEVEFQKELILSYEEIKSIIGQKYDKKSMHDSINNFGTFFLVNDLNADNMTNLIFDIVKRLSITPLNYRTKKYEFKIHFEDAVMADDRFRLLKRKEINEMFDGLWG